MIDVHKGNTKGTLPQNSNATTNQNKNTYQPLLRKQSLN
jgi:hypothetical protein